MRILLASVLFAALTASAQTPIIANYEAPKNPVILASTFVDWDSLIPKTTAVGLYRSVFDNPTPAMDKLEVHITTLNPGMESHPPHRHSWEEMLLMKDGEVEVSINGVKHRAGPGSLIFLAANDPHNAKNVSTRPATYYVINFVTGLSHAADAKSAAEQALPGKLASAVYDCNAQPSTPTPTGSHVFCVNSPTLTFLALESHITTLNPGQHTVPDQIDPNDELVIVKSGQVEVTVNGVASRMNAGSLAYWVPNAQRTVRNIGATPTSYQIIRVTSAKSPKPPAAN